MHLFDLVDYDEPKHACAGPVCRYCATAKTGAEAGAKGRDAAKKDPRWWHEAHQFFNRLAPAQSFTSDDLLEAIGHPDGHPAQIGAFIRGLAAADLTYPLGYTPSVRKSSHGRPVRIWGKR